MYQEFHGIAREDQALRDRYFPDYDYKGIFLDIGAGHPITISNSYHFRRNGWEIYSIDANPRLATIHRDVDYRIVECAVGSVEEIVDFDAYTNDHGWGGNVSSFIPDKGEGCETIQVICRTIDDVLAHEFSDIGHIDIFSMDIELAEMDALKGFDLNKHRPTVMLVEDHFPDKSGLSVFMQSYGYKLDYELEVSKFYI